MTEKKDMNLKCIDCGNEFVFTVGAQEFMEGLKRDGKLDRRDESTGEIIAGQVTIPKRCEYCRDIKKSKYSK